jgi:hypothetical protein
MTTEKWCITSRYDLEQANARRGHHFFEPGSMRFFRSRIGNVHPLPFGAIFVTSEQFRGSDGYTDARRYTLRHCLPNGEVETLGEFQQFATSAQANRVAKALAAWCAEIA